MHARRKEAIVNQVILEGKVTQTIRSIDGKHIGLMIEVVDAEVMHAVRAIPVKWAVGDLIVDFAKDDNVLVLGQIQVEVKTFHYTELAVHATVVVKAKAQR